MMRFKTRSSMPAAIFAATLLAALVAGNASAVTLDFECGPPDCSFFCDDTLDVYVTIDAVTDLRGYSLTLEYDAAVVQPILVERGDLVDGTCPFVFFWLNPTPPFGSIYADGAGPGCSVGGPGRLIHIRFIGVGHGTTTIRCTGSLLRDSLNNPIAHSCNEKTLTFNCPPVPTRPASWGAVKRGED